MIVRSQIPVACWTEGLSFLLVVPWGHFLYLDTWVVPTWSTCFTKTSKIECPLARFITNLCRVTMEMASYHLCHNLEASQMSCLHSTGGDYREIWIPGARDHGGHLRFLLPHPPLESYTGLNPLNALGTRYGNSLFDY